MRCGSFLLAGCGRRWIPIRSGPVDFADEFAVHGSCGVEGGGEFVEFGFEFGDSSAVVVVVGFEFGGALFELIDEWVEVVAAGGVGVGAELSAEPVAEHGQFLVEASGLFFGVGEFGAQALLGDQ